MPEITLNIPKNSRFHSSLNEIDLAIREVLLYCMKNADPRDKTGLPNSLAIAEKNNWLWDYSRIFQVDELETEEIFNTYLLRKKVNGESNTDISYPILAFMQEDVDTVFWGTGNRYRQWEFEIPSLESDLEVGDEVIILSPNEYRGTRALISDIITENTVYTFHLAINGSVITTKNENNKQVPLAFQSNQFKASGDKLPKTFKAKAVTCKYSCVILADNRDEIQYIRNNMMLRTLDANIWFTYASPALDGSANHIYTVFGIPNIGKYPSSTDKIKGRGYIYGSAFEINVWGCVTDKPLPQDIIETIRMDLHVETDKRINRIVITDDRE